MGQRYYLPIIAAAVILACGAEKGFYPHEVHPTITKLDRNMLQDVLHGDQIPKHISVQTVPQDLFPVAGTVSHHLLVAPLINNWFKELKRLRKVSTFIIISPRHFDQGREDVSFSSLAWDAGNGRAEPDKECIAFLRNRLGLPEDPEAMHLEHGIGALLPYIIHYFPDAQIVPVVIDEHHARTDQIEKLSAAICKIIQDSCFVIQPFFHVIRCNNFVFMFKFIIIRISSFEESN